MTPDVRELLERVRDVLDNYSDVIDGDSGQPLPNAAMSAMTDIDAMLARAEREAVTGPRDDLRDYGPSWRRGLGLSGDGR